MDSASTGPAGLCGLQMVIGLFFKILFSLDDHSKSCRVQFFVIHSYTHIHTVPLCSAFSLLEEAIWGSVSWSKLISCPGGQPTHQLSRWPS